MREDIKALLTTAPDPPWVRMVRDFQREKLPFVTRPSNPIGLTATEKLQCISSILEEHEELVRACALDDTAGTADAIVDSIYVLIDMGLRMGLPLGALFDEVHTSNMEKLPAGSGTRGRATPGGGSMKPPGWQKPRIREILGACEAPETPIRLHWKEDEYGRCLDCAVPNALPGCYRDRS